MERHCRRNPRAPRPSRLQFGDSNLFASAANADASPKFDSRSDGNAGAGKRISHQRCADRRASTIANPRARRNHRYCADSRLRCACSTYVDTGSNLDTCPHLDSRPHADADLNANVDARSHLDACA